MTITKVLDAKVFDDRVPDLSACPVCGSIHGSRSQHWRTRHNGVYVTRSMFDCQTCHTCTEWDGLTMIRQEVTPPMTLEETQRLFEVIEE